MRQPLREALDLGRLVRRCLERLGEQADRADRGLQLVADVGDEVAAHVVEPVRLGAVVGEQQHEPRLPSRATRTSRCSWASPNGRARKLQLAADRDAVATHLVDQADQLGMHERLIPDQSECESAPVEALITLFDASSTTPADSSESMTSSTPSGTVGRDDRRRRAGRGGGPR